MALEQPVESYQTVQTWSRGLKEQWGGDPLAEDSAKLKALSSFCAAIDKDPDELYNFCFLRKRDTGERFASKKRREELTEQIRQYIISSNLRGTDARRHRSNIYSFFSHNGILI